MEGNSANYRVEWRQRKDPFWLPGLFYIYAPAATAYLVWRSTVINWHVWFGPLVYLAELYGLFTTALFLFFTRRMYVPVHRPVTGKHTVDVFIPTYTEPLSVLEPVVAGAIKVRGVRDVFVLDDGNRREVRNMSKRLGVKYYPRMTNKHAKAGNYNNGLRRTDAEFLLMLDADHIPMENFLEKTLGYFDDPQVAFVQTPQSYYNRGTFLFRKCGVQADGWSEQKMFYDCIQPAKNRWNSAFFVGTSAVMRRSAIDSVGGFATGTATEDIHTSLRLHARGWKSVFLPESLAFGLEAENLKEFYKQRKRWAAGSLGLLFRSPDSPLFSRGLSLGQRLNYISATMAHLQGVQKACFFMTPILALFTLRSPVNITTLNYALAFALFLVLSIGITRVYSRGTYHLLHTEAYSLANMMAHFGGIKGIIKVQKKFAVSSKSSRRRERTWINWVLWGMAGLAVAALARGFWLYLADHNHNPLIICSLVFTLTNLCILMSFLFHLRKFEQGHAEKVYTVLSPRPIHSMFLGGDFQFSEPRLEASASKQ